MPFTETVLIVALLLHHQTNGVHRFHDSECGCHHLAST
jgi:hypothetical protein